MKINQPICDSRKSFVGSIHFELPKLSYFAGELIKGNILINIKEGNEGSLLVVCLEGIEEMSQNTSNKKQSTSIKRFLNQSKMIYDFYLMESEKQLKSGQYKIGFDIQIPEEIPSQVNLFYELENCYRINYFLCAYIVPINLAYKPIQGVQRVLIAKQNQIGNTPVVQFLKDYPKIFFFLALGNYTLKCNLPKSYFYPGESAILSIDFDFSNFERKVKEIKIELIGYLQSIKEKKSQYQKEFNILSTSSEIKQKKGTLQSEIFIPITTPLSIQGELAKLEYFLILTPVLSGNCNVKSLKQNIIIKPNNNYFKNIHLPTIKQLKQTSSSNKISKQIELNTPLQIQQQNDNIFQQFNNTQSEYQFYYSFEKDYNST